MPPLRVFSLSSKTIRKLLLALMTVFLGHQVRLMQSLARHQQEQQQQRQQHTGSTTTTTKGTTTTSTTSSKSNIPNAIHDSNGNAQTDPLLHRRPNNLPPHQTTRRTNHLKTTTGGADDNNAALSYNHDHNNNFKKLQQELVTLPTMTTNTTTTTTTTTTTMEEQPKRSVIVSQNITTNDNENQIVHNEQNLNKDQNDDDDDDDDDVDDEFHELPEWIQRYVTWHHDMRQKFPTDEALLTHPDAPPMLIRMCIPPVCGGLHDRLGQLPWDLYLANQTNRLLLLHWHVPAPLETFLVPPPPTTTKGSNIITSLDWRVPLNSKQHHFQAAKWSKYRIQDMFEGTHAFKPEEVPFWTTQFDECIAKAKAIPPNTTINTELNYTTTTSSSTTATSWNYKHRILRHRLLGHLDEHRLEERLRALGETDMIHSTATFGRIFRLFFQLAPPLQQQLDHIYQHYIFPNENVTTTVSSTPKEEAQQQQDQQSQQRQQQQQQLQSKSRHKHPPYSAVHCRVRHPKQQKEAIKGKKENAIADEAGLLWEGDTRLKAITTANRALQCAKTLLPSPQQQQQQQQQQQGRKEQQAGAHEPIYFLSDTSELVHYMSYELYNPEYLKAHHYVNDTNDKDDQYNNSGGAVETNNQTISTTTTTTTISPVEQLAYNITQQVPVVARPATDQNLHIDRQRGAPAQVYYGTFIDLFLAMNARCVTYGVGFYAVFATKISHTSCKLLYQEQEWGAKARDNAPICHL